MHTPQLEPAIPQLPTGDIHKTAQFFADHLGFTVVKKINDNFLILKRGPAEIHFWQTSNEQEARDLGRASSCYIRVKNIEELYSEFKNRGVAFRYGLTPQPWGMNEMPIDDPYLNAIRFGEAL